MFISSLILCASLVQNAIAITNSASEIASAIVARGGTTPGGLKNAASAIRSIDADWPKQWEVGEDGTPHSYEGAKMWFYFGETAKPKIVFQATIMATNGLKAIWSDGVTNTFAASTTYKGMTFSHTFTENGYASCEIIGFDSIRLNYGDTFTSECVKSARQIQVGLRFDETSFNANSLKQSVYAAWIEGLSLENSFQFRDSSIGYFYGLHNATKIGQYSYTASNLLKETDFSSSLTNISGTADSWMGAFSACHDLISIGDTQGIESIGKWGFANCYSLTNINLNSCKEILGWTFTKCYSLRSINAPVLERLGTQSFNYCTNITEVYIPECLDISQQCFENCYNLTNVIITACTNINVGAFQFSGLKRLHGPSVISIKGSAIRNNPIEDIDLPVATLFEEQWYIGNLKRLNLPSLESNRTFIIGYSDISNCEIYLTGLRNVSGSLVRSIGNNQNTVHLGVTMDTALAGMESTFPWGFGTNTKFICTDGELRYTNGSWTKYPLN